MDNACIIGYGMVGKAFADVFGIKKIYTRNPEESTINLKEASECNFVFICLPTPVNEKGEYITKDIEDIINRIEAFGNTPLYVIRSTVYPGFAKSLGNDRILSNPEFLSEDTAIEDTKNAPFILIGGTDTGYVSNLAAFYQARIKGSPFYFTDNTTAEMAKLTMNAYFATKVVFANEVFDACQNLDINYGTVKKVLESHPYGPKNHFEIFFKGKRGVRGRCLPKDSKAFVYYTQNELVDKAVEINERLLNGESI